MAEVVGALGLLVVTMSTASCGAPSSTAAGAPPPQRGIRLQAPRFTGGDA